MTQLEALKKNISEFSHPMEIAGLLDGVRVAAALYCKDHYPDEVIWENGQLEEVTIYGMCHFLESGVPEYTEKEAEK